MADIITEDTVQQIFKVLKTNSKLRDQLLELLQPAEFVHRDELAFVLAELKKQHEENSKNFQTVFQRFEAVDKRFEAVDKRFEELIDSMNKHFEAVDKRFEAIDKRFEVVV